MKNLTKIAMLASLYIGQTSVVNGQEFPSFYENFDRPLKVAAYLPVPEFMENLLRFDSETQMLSREDEWVSFSKADIWIYFIENISEFQSLGEWQQRAIEFGTGFPQTRISKRVTLNLTGGQKGMMVFINVSAFSNMNMAELSCRTAAITYQYILGTSTDFTIQQAVADCVSSKIE